ncbi:nitrilase-related carbon-nitrogen hydrolase [Mesorhizobium sp. M0013]|uniref:nitrilase-related carbon-nitrogen hydrolase n=1 Tax=Mesorhizobium sp. M0013 TaxID=2956841 RepID=UPI0033391339
MQVNETAHSTRPLISVSQYAPVHGEVTHNLDLSLQKIAEASDRKASIVILPECCTTGLVFGNRADLFDLAEEIDGPSVAAWRSIASRLNIYLIAGMAEREGNRLYNTAVTVAPDGAVLRYRKAHVFGGERSLFDLGDQLACVETPWGRIGLAVCYDLWFPELTRALAKSGATLIASPSNWFVPPRQSSDAPDATPMAIHLAIAAACSNEITVACADRTGEECGVRFLGNSFIVGPNGRLLAGPASASEDDCLVAEWGDASLTRKMVQSHMDTRREQLYDSPVVALNDTTNASR